MKKVLNFRLTFGLLLLLAGVLYLLCSLNIIPEAWHNIVISWQMLLIFIGLANLLHRQYISAVITVAVGIIFLLPKLSMLMGFAYNSAIVWAVVIMFIGILSIIRGILYPHGQHHFCSHRDNMKMDECKTTVDGVVDYKFIMSGSDDVFLGKEFRGGEISTFMGGMQLDLRRTSLPEGETKLKISSMFGGVKLLIPNDWNIEVRNNSFLGGFSDKREISNVQQDRKLIIFGNFMFGGGEISDVDNRH